MRIVLLWLFMAQFGFGQQLNALSGAERKLRYRAAQQTLKPSKIVCGAEATASYLGLLKGKRLALVVNPSSRIKQVHLVDSLLSLGIPIKKIFAPEHGFRGTADAGEILGDAHDPKTGLEIVSLYGKHVMPSAQDLSDVDLVVFDLQDVGARFYTYLSTLHYVMKACATEHKDLLILDRPNPNGFRIDGPVLDTLTCRSFVGLHPVPITYGMTIGEYAQMINGEGWLGPGLKASLKVIKLQGYTHRTPYELPIAPSPNLASARSIFLYSSLCLFEGTVISVGRGTDFAFEVYGHPLLRNTSFSFKPQSVAGKSKHPPYEGVLCHGVDLRTAAGGDDVKSNSQDAVLKLRPDTITLSYLLNAYANFPDKSKFFNRYFEKLAGNTVLRGQIERGVPESQIRLSWKEPLEQFKRIRQKYLLYP